MNTEKQTNLFLKTTQTNSTKKHWKKQRKYCLQLFFIMKLCFDSKNLRFVLIVQRKQWYTIFYGEERRKKLQLFECFSQWKLSRLSSSVVLKFKKTIAMNHSFWGVRRNSSRTWKQTRRQRERLLLYLAVRLCTRMQLTLLARLRPRYTRHSGHNFMCVLEITSSHN